MYDVIIKEDVSNETIKIENMIYEIRGVQVMLDSDLAMLYQCANGTKSINLAVKRHPNRFPERFMFQLTQDEYYEILRFQNETLELKQGQYSKYLPYVFTESGVSMLATVLKTKVAEEISVRIMDAFVKMRHFIIENKDIYKSLSNINNELSFQRNRLLEHDEKFNYLFSKFDKKEQLIEKGTMYDAYSSVVEILNSAEKEVTIIDSYADIKLLDLIRNIKCMIFLITRESPRLSDIEIKKYNEQYGNLEVVRNNSFHDRYIILDKKEIYLLGSSINNIGNKTSMIIKLTDKLVVETLLKNIESIKKNKGE